jgi:hypothetical protein
MNRHRTLEKQLSFPGSQDKLAVKDSIPSVSEEILPTNVCAELFSEGDQIEIEELLSYLENNAPSHEDEYPENFASMLDTASGNLLQRAIKMWIIPRDPEGTIRLMEKLKVHKFQAIPVGVFKKMRKAAGIDKQFQSNYTLGKPNLNSMVDFATNQNTLNEIIHLFGMINGIIILLPFLISGRVEALTLSLFMINTYCVLAQRYSRARISIVIDKALARKKNFNPKEYKNLLRLKLPPNTY